MKPKDFNLSECIPQSEDTGIKQFEHKLPKAKKENQRKTPDDPSEMDRFD